MSELNESVWRELIEPIAEQMEAKKSGLRSLVHYTSFSALSSIVASKEIWFSSADTMNDYQELRHGKDLIQRIAKTEGSALRTIFQHLKSTYPSQFESVDQIFDRQYLHDPFDSFISCWSNADTTVRDHDNLAMWRGYAADGNGVAIVIDPVAMQLGSVDLSDIVFWPVHYETDNQLADRCEVSFRRFSECLDALTAEQKEKAHPRIFAEAFNEIVYFLAASHKHNAFLVEQEWRFIWRRNQTAERWLDYLKPQSSKNGLYEYFCFPIQSDPELTTGSLELKDIVSEVMIGPTGDKPHKIRAVTNLLQRNGFDMNRTAVTVSEVPYRSKL